MVFSMSLEGRWLQPSLIGKHLGESPLVIGEAGLLKGVVLMVAEELVCIGMPVGQLKEMAWTLVL